MRHTAFVNRLDNLQHFREERITVTDRGLSHRLRIDVFQHQVTIQKETVAVRDAVDSLQPTIDVVLVAQHKSVYPRDGTLAGGRLDEDLCIAHGARVKAALVASALQALTVFQTGKDVRFGNTRLSHSLVKMNAKQPSRKTAINGSRLRLRLVLNDQLPPRSLS